MENIGDIVRRYKESGINIERSYNRFSFGTEQECTRLFYEALKLTDKSIKNVIRIPEHKEVINWMQDTKGQGLLLTGDCGRGKSSILLGVLPVLFSYKFKKLLSPISAIELNNAQRITDNWAYCVDDVGMEGIKNNYGEKYNVFSIIMADAERYLKPVFITTNLNSEQIQVRYDQRTLDRLVRLCRVIRFQGDSLRQTTKEL